jgi:hypothetical protein
MLKTTKKTLNFNENYKKIEGKYVYVMSFGVIIIMASFAR